MTSTRRMAAVLVAAVLAALPATLLPARAGDASADENGYRIAEGDSFSLDMHFLVQFQAVRDKLRTRVHGSYWTWFDEFDGLEDGPVSSTTPATDSFTVRRARVIFAGKAFRPWLSFRVEVESSSRETSDPDLMDAYVRLGGEHGFAATVGQFKAPFDTFRLVRSWKQLFAERPLPADQLAPGRDIGLGLDWRSESGRYLLRVAAQNGSGRNLPDTDNGIMTTVRFEVQNEGGFAYDLSGVTRPEDLQYAFGVAWLNNPVGGLVDADSRSTCLPGISRRCVYDKSDQQALELFGAVRARGFQATVSWQSWTFEDGRVVNVAGKTADRDFTALEAEAGLFLGEQVEVAGLYSRTEDDDYGIGRTILSGTVLVAEEWDKYESQQFGLGVNWYFDEHNLKLHVGWLNTKRRVRTRAREVTPGFDVGHEGKVSREVPAIYAMLSFYL